jgi:hypothetical protein
MLNMMPLERAVGSWQPHFSSAFFSPANFKLYTNGSVWATWKIEAEQDMANNFSVMNFLLTLPDVPLPRLPAAGLEWGQSIQLIVNIQCLFRLHMDVDPRTGRQPANVPILACLDTLLREVSTRYTQESWARTPRHFSVAIVRYLESLILTFVRWYRSAQMTNLVVVEATDHGPPASTILLLNPHMTWNTLQGSLVSQLQAWESDVRAGLGSQRHLSSYLNESISPPSYLFASGAARTPLGGVPTDRGKSGRGDHRDLDLPGIPSRKGGDYDAIRKPPAGERADRCPADAGPKTAALQPPIAWKSGQLNRASAPGKVLSNLFSVVPDVKPCVMVSKSNGHSEEQALSFPFSADSGSPDTGCDGKCWSNRRCRWDNCNRAHVCFSSSDWSSLPKTAYQPLWNWLQQPAVQEFIEPSLALRTLMK